MKRLIISTLFTAIFCFINSGSVLAKVNELPTLRMVVGEDVIEIALEGNSAAANFAKMLPLELRFRDYNKTEKIAVLPEKLDVSGSPDSCDPMAGSFTYFIPWGNLAIFYQDFRHSENLVSLGRILTGIDFLKNRKGDFTARIETVNSE